MEDIRLVTRATIGEAARTLAAAFETDPVWRWLVPSEKVWRRHAARLFAADMGNRLRHGEIYATAGFESIAAWSPPGMWEPTVSGLLRETPAGARLFRRNTVRTLRFLSGMEAEHPKQPPHFYLAELGTAPSHQGHGFGHAVLEPVLARCDEQGIPAYLESSKEQNLAFYARHGFVESDPLVLGDAPPVWPMWREPASA